jgi:hypothetical protein
MSGLSPWCASKQTSTAQSEFMSSRTIKRSPDELRDIRVRSVVP